jgi:hypothetical protein
VRQLGLSYTTCILDHVARAKRRAKPKARQIQIHQGQRQEGQAQPPGPTKRVSGLSPPQILERIEDAKATQQEAEAELAVLVDKAVILGIGWPEIATRLGVTRQAARQHYQRRHRDRTIR